MEGSVYRHDPLDEGVVRGVVGDVPECDEGEVERLDVQLVTTASRPQLKDALPDSLRSRSRSVANANMDVFTRPDYPRRGPPARVGTRSLLCSIMGVFKVPGSTLLDRMREEAGMRFRGRVVVVTGSGSGLGRYIAHRFAAEGTAVVVADAVERAAGEVANEISRARGRALGYKAAVAE